MRRDALIVAAALVVLAGLWAAVAVIARTVLAVIDGLHLHPWIAVACLVVFVVVMGRLALSLTQEEQENSR